MSGIKKITDEVKSAIANSVEPMKNLTTKAKDMASKSASSVSQMKAQMKNYSGSIQETAKQQEHLKAKIEDLKYLLSQADMGFEVGDTLKIEADIEKLENRLKKLQSQGQNTGKETSNAFDKIKAKIKSTGTHLVGLGDKFKNILSNSKNLGKNFTTSFNSGIKSIKKFALGLLSVRTAFSMVSKAMQSYLSYDTQLANSVQNCWNVLGSLLAPILEYIISLFSKAVSYVNAFVQALTGINLVARANKKAIDSQAKSTKRLSEVQSSLDEFHTINTNNGSGGQKQEIKVEEIDMTPLQKFVDKVKSIFAQLFIPFKEAWAKEGQSVVNSMKKSFKEVGTLGTTIFKSFSKVWNDGTGTTYLTSILNISKQVSDIIGGLSKSFTDAWNSGNLGNILFESLFGALTSINEAISSILDSFILVINNGTVTEIFSLLIEQITQIFDIVGALANAFTVAWTNAGVGNSIVQSICNIFKDIQKLVLSIGDSLLKWIVSDEFQEALNKVFGFIDDIFKYVQDICDWLLSMYETYIKPVIDDKLLPAITSIVNAIMDIWNVVKPVVDWCIEVIKAQLEPVIQGLMQFIGGIINVVKGIADFISGVFTLNWKKAWEGIKTIFKGIWDMLASIIKTPINTLLSGVEFMINKLIDGFNALKKAINKISFDVPDWVPGIGGKTWGFNLEMSNPITIPRLASGGVLSEEAIVKVAEYSNAKSNPEIISPKDMMKETMKEAIEESGMNNQTAQKVEADVTGELRIDGNDLVIVYDKNKKEKGYDGKNNPSFAY